jgi:hypothetical protein
VVAGRNLNLNDADGKWEMRDETFLLGLGINAIDSQQFCSAFSFSPLALEPIQSCTRKTINESLSQSVWTQQSHPI